MTNQPLHPLPPEVWGEPPVAAFDPHYDCAPGSPTTSPPTENPPTKPPDNK